MQGPKFAWIDRVLERRTAIGMVAVGSSHIWTAFDAVRVSRALYGDDDSVVNLGLNGEGRGRDYLVVEHALERTGARVVVVEVGPESSLTHPDFHKLADLAHVFGDPNFRRIDLQSLDHLRWQANFIGQATVGNLVAGYAQLLHREIHAGAPERGPSPWDATGGSHLVDSPPYGGALVARQPSFVPHRSMRGIAYLRKISELCRRRGVDLVLLEIPSYTDPPLTPEHRGFLQGLGTLIEYGDLDGLYRRRELWRNAGHLNRAGARLLTDVFLREWRRLRRVQASSGRAG